MSSQNPGNLRALAVNRLLVIAVVLFLSAAAFAQNNPVPLIYQPLKPDAAEPGGASFRLIVVGTGFAPGAVLNWNGSPRMTTVINSRTLHAQIHAEDIATASTAAITVSNPAPGGGRSNVIYFPIRHRNNKLSFSRIDTPLGLLGAVAVGDFNNDGKPDVAVGQNQGINGSNIVLVYLGNGDGSFGNPLSTPTKKHYQPASMLASDFNGDGNLDLAVSDDQGSVAIFLGDGSGTFNQLAPLQTSAESGQSYLAAADVNQDGKLDLITSGSRQGNFLTDVFLGNGDGTFSLSETLFSTSGPGHPSVADLDHDTTLDIAIPDGALVDFYGGNGDGTFQSPKSYSTPLTSTALAVADFAPNGDLDIVTNGFSFLLNEAGKGLQDVQDIAAGGNSYDIAVADFNGDLTLDFALVDVSGGQANIDLFRGGTNVFESPISLSSGINAGRGLGVADFNNDGFIDLVNTSDFGSPALSVYLQTTLRADKSNLTFGGRQIGAPSKPKKLILTNLSVDVVNITSIGISGQNAGDFSQTNDCGSQLAGRDNCKIKVVFTPADRGARLASLDIAYDGPGSPISIPLSGTGLLLQLSLTPSSMTFDTQLVETKSPPQIATLANNGSDAADILGIGVSKAFQQTNDCPDTLEPGASCEIRVVFKPQGRGVQPGELVVKDGIAGGQRVSLSGVGTVVKLSVESIDFGDQPVDTSSSPAHVKLTNKGVYPFNISSIEIDGHDPADFTQTNDCAAEIGPGDSCTINITFTPTQTGRRTASLTIMDDGGGGQQSVVLAGNGT